MPAAVVLAGGGPEPQLAPGAPNKAFLEIAGRALVRTAVDAVRGVGGVDRVLVVGPEAPLRTVLGADAEIVPEQASLMDNLAAAVAALGGAGRVLTVASDLPLLSAAVVGEFLRRCEASDAADGPADFFYAVARQQTIEDRFPTARKTYVKVVEGTFCGGSVLLFDAATVARVRPFVEQVIAARKKPWLLAQLLGWGIVMKFASGRLSIAELESRVREVTGLRGRVIVLDGPELALDVDAERPENLQAVLAEVAGR